MMGPSYMDCVTIKTAKCACAPKPRPQPQRRRYDAHTDEGFVRERARVPPCRVRALASVHASAHVLPQAGRKEKPVHAPHADVRAR